MSKLGDIIFNFIDIWAKEHEIYSVQGTVKSVDEDKRTCIVTPGKGADILDVRLESDYTQGSTSSPKGLFIVPAVGSIVLVTFLNKEDAFLSSYGQIDKIISIQGEFIFNDGTNEGLVKAPELKTQVDKNTKILEEIQKAFNSWIVTPNDGGAALKTLSSSFTSLDRADLSDIQNLLIKH